MILRGPFLSFVFSLILFSIKNQGDWNGVGAYTNIVFISFVILLLCKFSTILFSLLCFSAPNPCGILLYMM